MTHEELVERVATAIYGEFHKYTALPVTSEWPENWTEAVQKNDACVELIRIEAREAIRITGEAALSEIDGIEDLATTTIIEHPKPSEIEGLDGLLVPLFRAARKIQSLTQGNKP